MEREEAVTFIRELADASAEVILPYFANPALQVEWKSDETPVTVADRAAEEVMRQRIQTAYPDHGIVGEEFGNVNSEARYCWVLDPIDGTKSFVAGCPLFGTLICLLEDGQPILGAIHSPVTRQFIIGDNHKTTLNGVPVQIGSRTDLSQCIACTSDLRTPSQERNPEAWTRFVAGTGRLMTWGDCYGYILLAHGGIDVMLDAMMSPWDLLALIPVIRGAGGVITDWHGNDPVTGNSIVAANKTLHPLVVQMLNS